MQAAHQVLQEEFECLRQAKHRLAVDHEGGYLLSAVLHDLAVVSGGVVGADHGRGGAAVLASVHHAVQPGVVRSAQPGELLRPGELAGEGRHPGETELWRAGEHGGHGDHGEGGGGEGWRGGGGGEGAGTAVSLGGAAVRLPLQLTGLDRGAGAQLELGEIGGGGGLRHGEHGDGSLARHAIHAVSRPGPGPAHNPSVCGGVWCVASEGAGGTGQAAQRVTAPAPPAALLGPAQLQTTFPFAVTFPSQLWCGCRGRPGLPATVTFPVCLWCGAAAAARLPAAGPAAATALRGGAPLQPARRPAHPARVSSIGL